jgi:hypothetical protein
MKKIILPIAVVLTMLFSACSSNEPEPLVDNVTEKCWEYNYSALGVSVKDYYWATAKEFGEFKTLLESMYGTVTSYKSVSKSELECGSSGY